jgi:CubicO group peptidase (beta-lactamase class C family)
MRHATLASAAVVVLLLAGAPVRAQDPIDGLLYGRFQDYLESLRAQAGIPGLSAAIVGRDAVLWEAAFGRQDLERLIATRTDTPFHLDGLTQVFTASLVLRCAEEGRLSLDNTIGQYVSSSPYADVTLRQALSHTSGPADNLVFDYRPERLAPLAAVVRSCASDSFRETVGNLFDRLAMRESVPGPDASRLKPPAEGIPSPAVATRYADVLERLAVPYAVDRQGRASPASYSATTLTPAEGLVSTVRDFANFDLALKRDVLLRARTLALAWQAPVAQDGRALPHGLGWFVQTHDGEPVVWQFGAGEDGSSSLVVTLPGPGLTLILLANSNGLVKSFPLEEGDVAASPFGKVFLGLFAR